VLPRNVSTDDQLLSTVRSAFDPRTAAFPSLVQAVLAFTDDAFQLLLADGGKHVARRDLELFSDTDSGRAQFQNGHHQFAALVQRQSGKVAVVVNKKVEDEVEPSRENRCRWRGRGSRRFGASKLQSSSGILSVGRYADFTVPSADPYQMTINDLGQLTVHMTVVAGHVSFDSSIRKP
jgi:hypothetical protein